MTSLYDAIRLLTQKLIGFSDMTLRSIPKSVVKLLNYNELGLFYMLSWHYHNELVGKTKYLHYLPHPTVKDIRAKNEKHSLFTKQIMLSVIIKKEFVINSGKIVVNDPYTFTGTEYWDWYDYVKPMRVKKGKWTPIVVSWNNLKTLEHDSMIICYHDVDSICDLHNLESSSRYVPLLSKLIVCDLEKYRDVVLLNEGESENGLVVNVGKNEANILYYGKFVCAFMLKSLNSQFPVLFDMHLVKEFVDPFRGIPDFYKIGFDHNIVELERLCNCGIVVSRDSWNCCLMGAMKNPDRQISFIKYLVGKGANDFDEIVCECDGDKVIMDYVIEMKVNNLHRDTFLILCIDDDVDYVKHFMRFEDYDLEFVVEELCNYDEGVNVIKHFVSIGKNFVCGNCGKLLSQH